MHISLKMQAIFLLLALVPLALAVPNAGKFVVEADKKYDGDESRIEHLVRSIMENQLAEREYIKKYTTDYYTADIVGFSWNNCGAKTDPIQVKTLKLSPDPISIPGEEQVSFDISISEDVRQPTKVDVVVEKKVFGVFIKVPCIDNIGSCTYDNPCSLLSNVTQCPQPLVEHHIPCKCPFPKGEYKLPASTIQIPKLNLPSIVENGEYKVSGTLYNGATRLACYQVDASLKKV